VFDEDARLLSEHDSMIENVVSKKRLGDIMSAYAFYWQERYFHLREDPQ
jgi:hypothetical protein